MGSNPRLGYLVHFLCSDLELHRGAVGTYNGRVQGLIAIRFGKGNVILEFSWHRLIEGM